MIIIGIIAHQGHCSTVAILKNGKIIASQSEERLSRIKEDSSLPVLTIKALLSQTQINMNEVDHIAFAWDPIKSFKSNISKVFFPSKSTFQFLFEKRKLNGGISRVKKFKRMLQVKKDIRELFGNSIPVKFLDHHICHSFSSYIQSGFDTCLSVVIDGAGEKETISIYSVEGLEHKMIEKVDFPNSIGIFYSTITQYLGFRPDYGEYKVMGLSSYGKSDTKSKIKSLYSIKPFKLNLKYFSHQKDSNKNYSQEFINLFGPSEKLSFEQKANIAKQAQDAVEEIVISILDEVLIKYPFKKICFSGGVFQNCVLNQKIRDKNKYGDLFFSPICSDLGTAIGACLYSYSLIKKENGTMGESLYLGQSFSDEEIESSLKSFDYKYEKVEEVEVKVCNFLLEGKIIGWFQGKAELGPRALGNRSILADPMIPGVKDKINSKIKKRESFRPFAPSVLDTELDKYFNFSDEFRNYYYMIETLSVKETAKVDFPEAVHVNGTSRLQSVTEKLNPRYHRLLSEFKKVSGRGAIINTSFNMSDEPIVNTPIDAIKCFENGKLDLLVLNNYIVYPND